MNTKTNESATAVMMDKQALGVFGGLTILVYSIALTYCYATNHLFEAGVMGAVMLGLAILIGSMYTSIGQKSKNKQQENH